MFDFQENNNYSVSIIYLSRWVSHHSEKIDTVEVLFFRDISIAPYIVYRYTSFAFYFCQILFKSYFYHSKILYLS